MLLDKLHRATGTGQLELAKGLAHSLKGSFSIFGAKRAARIAAQIEESAEARNAASMGDLLSRLETEIAAVNNAIKGWSQEEMSRSESSERSL